MTSTSSRFKLRIIRAIQSPILTLLFLEAWKADLTWCQCLICRRYVGEVWLACQWSDKVIRYKKKISQPCNHISHMPRGKVGVKMEGGPGVCISCLQQFATAFWVNVPLPECKVPFFLSPCFLFLFTMQAAGAITHSG